jgi:hypothetical protein
MNLYIDVAISLVLVFLVFSIIVYVVQELVAVNLQYRGKMLWRALAQLLDNAVFKGKRSIGREGMANPGAETPLTDLFFNHPQIKALQRDDKTPTSYIPAENVGIALVDLVAQNANPRTGNLLNDFGSGLRVLEGKFAPIVKGFLPGVGVGAKVPNQAPPIVAVLQSITQISTSVDDLQKNIEKWYNEYMQRVTGWYQAHTVFTIRIIAVVVTLAFNLNCIRLVKNISTDSVLRSNLVGISERIADRPETITGLINQQFKKTADSIQKAHQPAIDSAKDPAVRSSLSNQRDSVVAAAVGTYTGKQIQSIRDLTDTLSTAHLAIGWRSNPVITCWKKLMAALGGERWQTSWAEILLALLGWAVTAGCLSMGAPFWFNLLIQLVNVRRTGVKPDDNKKKK